MVYIFPDKADIAPEFLKVGDKAYERPVKFTSGYQFPLLLKAIKSATRYATEATEIDIDALLDADGCNIHPPNISILIRRVIEGQTDKHLLGPEPSANGLQLWFSIARRFRVLDAIDSAMVLLNFAKAIIQGDTNQIELFDAFRICEYYFGNNTFSNLSGITCIAGLSDSKRGKLAITMGMNYTDWGKLTFTDVLQATEKLDRYIGKSDGVGFKSSSKSADADELVQFASNRIRCFLCHKLGHLSRNCPKRRKTHSYKRKPDSTYLIEVTDTDKVFMAKDNEIVIEQSDDDDIPYDSDEEAGEANYIEECYVAEATEPFVLDSGSTIHVTNDEELLQDPKPSNTQVKGINGKSTKVHCEGNVVMGDLEIKNVKFLPEAPRKLLSAHLLTEKGYEVFLNAGGGKILKDNQVVGTIQKHDKFWEVDETVSSAPNNEKLVFSAITPQDEIMKVHQANGHASFAQLKLLLENKFPDSDIKSAIRDCLVCASVVPKPSGKLTQEKFEVGELLQADVIGPINGIYALITSDRASSYAMVRILKYKSEVSAKLIECLGAFDNFLRLQGRSICRFRADNEFDTKVINAWLAGHPDTGRNAIEAEYTAPHSSYQNGGSEKLNSTLERKMRLVLKQSGVHLSFWNFAMNYVVFLHNYLPRVSTGRSPFEHFRDVEKKILNIQPFGCLVYFNNFFNNHKLEEKSSKGIFLGYHKSSKIAFVLESSSQKILRTSAFRTVDSQFPALKDGINPKQEEKDIPSGIAGSYLPFSGTIIGPDNNIEQDYNMSDYHPETETSDQSDTSMKSVPNNNKNLQITRIDDDNMEVSTSDAYPNSQSSSDIEVEFKENRVIEVESSTNEPIVQEVSSDSHSSSEDNSSNRYIKASSSQDPTSRQLTKFYSSSDAEDNQLVAVNDKHVQKIFKRHHSPSDSSSDNSPVTVLQKAPAKRRLLFDGSVKVHPQKAIQQLGKDSDRTTAQEFHPHHLNLFKAYGDVRQNPPKQISSQSKPLLEYPSNNPPEKALLSVAHNKYVIPNTYKEAMNSPEADKWKVAIQEELDAWKIQEVYEEIDVKASGDTSPIDMRWVFAVKAEPTGERFKARIVARGFKQEIGENYLDYWAPVLSFDSLRLVIAIAAINGYDICQMDAKTAFLNGSIDYNVNVVPPHGSESHGTKIWKLRKSVYGLKQSPKIWYETLSSVLHNKLCLKSAQTDPCVFYGKDLLVVIYVDDILITGKHQQDITKVKEVLSNNFTMKDLGFPKVFLGISLARLSRTAIKISSKDFITKIEKEKSLTKLTKIFSPMVKGYDPWDTKSPALEEKEVSLYKSLIGTLLYAANTTRIDISYPVNLLSQFISKPRVTHLKAARRVMQYIIQTKDIGIIYCIKPAPVEFKDFRLIDKSKYIDSNDYPAPSKFMITTMSDSDYATDKSDRKSQSGHIVMINHLVISWASRKQSCVTLSSTEAEYVALSDAARSSVYFRNLLIELGLKCTFVNLIGDNISALTLSSHRALNQKTKHIDVRYHFIRSLVREKIIKLNFVPTKFNLADILTKPLDPTTYLHLLKFLLE